MLDQIDQIYFKTHSPKTKGHNKRCNLLADIATKEDKGNCTVKSAILYNGLFRKASVVQVV